MSSIHLILYEVVGFQSSGLVVFLLFDVNKTLACSVFMAAIWTSVVSWVCVSWITDQGKCILHRLSGRLPSDSGARG